MINLNNSIYKELLRKLLHISSIWIIFVIYYLPQYSNIVFLSILSVLLIYEYCRKLENKFSLFLNKIFGGLLRSHEKSSKFILTGATYVLLAALLSNLIFPQNVAIIALSIMLISDTFAAIIGKIYGKIKLADGKSLIGSTTFFVVSILVIYIVSLLIGDNLAYNIRGIIFTALIATITELYSPVVKLDDNITITLISGLTILAIGNI